MNYIKWKLERIQLFFYNGCDNRWAMFEEGLSEAEHIDIINPESFYRIQVSRLLTTIRKALVEQAKVTKSVDVPPAYAQRSEFSVDLSGTNTDLKEAFVTYCSTALDREGISDPKLKVALGDLGANRKAVIPGGHLTANLLSVLPIARDWDVVGYLHPMSTGRARFMPEEYWWRSFGYRVSFRTPASDNRNRGDHQPLADDVFLQLLGDPTKTKDKYYDGKEFEIDPDPTKEIEYFAFAKSPSREQIKDGATIQARMTSEEFELYRLYGKVIDATQQKEASSTTTRGSSFYVVYPVIACGYYHFFQLEVRPNGKPLDQARLLDGCMDAFQQLLSVKGSSYHIFKESIRELLVQIRLSAFQHHVATWMTNRRAFILESNHPDEFACTCFCELAPLLNEMRAITRDNRAWSHCENSTISPQMTKGEDKISGILRMWREVEECDTTVSNNEVTEVRIQRETSIEWGDTEVKQQAVWLKQERYRIVDIQSAQIKMWLFHKGQESPFDEECFAGTNERRLVEQFEMVRERMRRFWYAGRP